VPLFVGTSYHPVITIVDGGGREGPSVGRVDGVHPDPGRPGLIPVGVVAVGGDNPRSISGGSDPAKDVVGRTRRNPGRSGRGLLPVRLIGERRGYPLRSCGRDQIPVVIVPLIGRVSEWVTNRRRTAEVVVHGAGHRLLVGRRSGCIGTCRRHGQPRGVV